MAQINKVANADDTLDGADGLAGDRLSGALAISDFLDETERRTYYLLEKKLIPAGKLGSTWIASKRKLREHYRQLTGGAA